MWRVNTHRRSRSELQQYRASLLWHTASAWWRSTNPTLSSGSTAIGTLRHWTCTFRTQCNKNKGHILPEPVCIVLSMNDREHRLYSADRAPFLEATSPLPRSSLSHASQPSDSILPCSLLVHLGIGTTVTVFTCIAFLALLIHESNLT